MMMNVSLTPSADDEELEPLVHRLVSEARAALREENADAAATAASKLAAIAMRDCEEATAAVRMYALGVMRHVIVIDGAAANTTATVDDHVQREAQIAGIAAALEWLETGKSSWEAAQTAVKEQDDDDDALGCAVSVPGARALRITRPSGAVLELSVASVHAPVRLSEGACVGRGSGCKVWGGGLVMAAALTCAARVVKGLSLLEIGSGTGITGIVAAALGARCVTLTDAMSDVIIGLEKSCALSRDAILEAGAHVDVRRLDWNEEGASDDDEGDNNSSSGGEGRAQYDLVIGSDIIYRENTTAAMARTMQRCAQRTLLLQAVRNPRLVAAFVEDVFALGGSVHIRRIPAFGLASAESDTVESIDLASFVDTSFPGGIDALGALLTSDEEGTRVVDANTVYEYAGSMIFLEITL